MTEIGDVGSFVSLLLLNRDGAKDAKGFLLVCYDPGRRTPVPSSGATGQAQDQNTPSPGGRGKGQRSGVGGQEGKDGGRRTEEKKK